MDDVVCNVTAVLVYFLRFKNIFKKYKKII